MKIKLSSLMICLFGAIVIASVARAQGSDQYGSWKRVSSSDLLTGRSRASYRFTQPQADGRIPFVYLFCEGGRVDQANLGYFTDTPIYYDANLNHAYGDLNMFSVVIQFRGATGKVKKALELVRVADGRRMTLTSGELDAFGHTGELVIQFPSSSGNLVTDVLRQTGGTVEDKQAMEADCFLGKSKK
jgi:hypothetical protein